MYWAYGISQARNKIWAAAATYPLCQAGEWTKLLQGQCWILNPLCHSGNSHNCLWWVQPIDNQYCGLLGSYYNFKTPSGTTIRKLWKKNKILLCIGPEGYRAHLGPSNKGEIARETQRKTDRQTDRQTESVWACVHAQEEIWENWGSLSLSFFVFLGLYPWHKK